MIDFSAYQSALLADGWSASPIYAGQAGQYDPAKSARFTREGFKIAFYRAADSLVPDGLAAWGPDRLEVIVPETYSWEALHAALLVCGACGAIGETVRIGFAGRVCPACREKYVDQVEKPGWNS